MSAGVLDTNVVVPLLHARAPSHALVLRTARSAIARGDRLVLLPQVIFECWVVATRPVAANGLGWTPAIAHTALVRLRDTFETIGDPPSLTEKWLTFVVEREVSGKRAHDARIAVAAALHGIHNVITFNGDDFGGFGPVSAVHPRDWVTVTGT